MAGCDIAVIGASTGGIEALRNLLATLPRTLPASLLAVIHIPDVASILPETLARDSGLPVHFAEDGQPLEQGQLLLAPPNHHLLLAPGERVRLAQTARENGFRPAVDPLFRSAARCYGDRVTGVVLSGALDDGASGLREIQRNGGVAIVQDFEEALFPSMPRAAAQQTCNAHVLRVAEIGIFVTKLAEQAASVEVRDSASREVKEVRIESVRQPTDLSCPQCGGVLRASPDASPVYACHVGHTYAPEALAADQSAQVDRALWSAIRVLHESAALRRSMARRARNVGLHALSATYEEQADEAEEKALSIQHIFEAPAPT